MADSVASVEQLLEELRKRREESEVHAKAVHDECGHANASLPAEIQLLSAERQACRDERRALSTALLQHRQEVSKHREWLFGAMESVAREREASVYSVASEGAKLDATRRAAEQQQKNAAYERAVVSKERAALSEHQKALSEQREEVNHEKAVLASTAAQLAAQREAVEAVAKETDETRAQLTALAHATAHEAQAVEQRQRLLHEEAEKLLKPPTPPPMVPTMTRGGTPRQFSTIGNPYEALGRANYTATALNLFTLPLVGSRNAGLPEDQLSHVDAATRAAMELFNIEPSGALSRLAVAPPATPSAAWPEVGRPPTAAPDVALESVNEAVGDD
jgi:hypothetical protein